MAKRLNHVNSSLRRSPRSLRTRKKDSVTKMKDRKSTSPSTAMNIINKFSQQFLRVDEDISFRDSPSRTREEIFSSSMDCYNFDEQDDNVRLRLDLSPIKPEKTPAQRKPRRTPATSGSKGNKRTCKEITNKENSAGNTASKNNSSCKRRRVDIVVKNNARNKKVTPKSQAIQTKSSKLKAKNSPTDSGVFMTPPSLYDNEMPTSTPSVTPACSKPHKKKQSKSQPEQQKSDMPSDCSFDMPESPMLSPVEKVNSPNSEEYGVMVTSELEMFNSMYYGSPQLKTSSVESSPETRESFKALDISKTYSSLGFGSGYFDKPIVEKSKKKKTSKKTERKSMSRYDIVADQMNQEFDDLDDFQLSVD